MRQTIKEIQVNVAYRWFLGLSLDDRVPHFTTYGKNYTRRFQEKALIEHIFRHVLQQAVTAGLVDPSEIFVDGTHLTAAANNRKYQNQVIAHQAAFMSEQLAVEIKQDWKKHAKKALFAKIEPFKPQVIIADSGYKNPSIAKFLLDNAITPLFPYTRPRGKKGMLRPNAFV